MRTLLGVGIGLCLAGLVALAAMGCSAVTRVEEPSFTTAFRDGDFELRRYGPRVVAETKVSGEWSEAGNEGFRRLFGYISGKNHGGAKIAMTAPVGQQRSSPASEKIAMTAPVGQRRDGGEWVVSFTMPESSTLETLPRPADARITLREIAPVEVVVVRFSGRWTVENMDEQTAAVRAWAASRRIAISDASEVARYDPPFMPWFMRRNEIWFAVAAHNAAEEDAR